jgi:hypothetical protein
MTILIQHYKLRDYWNYSENMPNKSLIGEEEREALLEEEREALL